MTDVRSDMDAVRGYFNSLLADWDKTVAEMREVLTWTNTFGEYDYRNLSERLEEKAHTILQVQEVIVCAARHAAATEEAKDE